MSFNFDRLVTPSIAHKPDAESLQELAQTCFDPDCHLISYETQKGSIVGDTPPSYNMGTLFYSNTGAYDADMATNKVHS